MTTPSRPQEQPSAALLFALYALDLDEVEPPEGHDREFRVWNSLDLRLRVYFFAARAKCCLIEYDGGGWWRTHRVQGTQERALAWLCSAEAVRLARRCWG